MSPRPTVYTFSVSIEIHNDNILKNFNEHNH